MGLELDIPEELGGNDRRSSREWCGGAGPAGDRSTDAAGGLGRMRRRGSVGRFVRWVETWARS